MTTELDKKAEAYAKKECDEFIRFGLSNIEMDLADFSDTIKDIFKAGYAEAQKVELLKLVDAYEADVKKDLNRDDLFSPNENVFFLRAFVRDYLSPQPPKEQE